MKGLILAAGLGTRLRPLTHTGAKQLIPVANKPVLEYAIEDLVEAGVREIGIVVGYTPERIQSVTEAVGDGSRWGVKVTYIEQDAPQGIAHAIYCGKEFVNDEPFVAYLGDNLLKGGIARFTEQFTAGQLDAGILLTEVDDPRPYGVAEFDEKGSIVDIHEKPKEPPSNMVVIGVYYLSAAVFDIIECLKPSDRGEYEITHALRELVKSGGFQVGSAQVEGWWDDTGSAEAVLRANHLVMADMQAYCKGTVEEGSRIVGNVAIDEGTIIKAGSFIRGPVIIGRNCQIGPTYLGPYTSIGDNCTIKGGEIESSIIIGDTRVDLESDKRIVDSLIGRHSVLTSARKSLPAGLKLTIGEHSEAQL